MASSQLGPIAVVLTDFERTLAQLFEEPDREREAYEAVWDIYTDHDLPLETRGAAGESPYSLWTEAHQWMKEHVHPDSAEVVSQAVAACLSRYELEAADSVQLFNGVRPLLRRLRTLGIPVAVVSNNSTEAVRRALKLNNAEGLIMRVFGRRPDLRMEDLKPSPTLLLEALNCFGCAADTALFVGDSVIDMAAGRAAGIGLTVGLFHHSTNSKAELSREGAQLVLSQFKDLKPLILGSIQS